MKLRYLVALAAGCALLFGAANASAVTRHATKVTLDSSVAVGNGYFVDSGRVITSGPACNLRPVRLIGIRPRGAKRLLDWTLTSDPGHAWATRSKRAGFQRVVAKVRKTKHCKGASVQVFPSPGPTP